MTDKRYITIQTYHIEEREKILEMLDDLKKADKTLGFKVVLSAGKDNGEDADVTITHIQDRASDSVWCLNCQEVIDFKTANQKHFDHRLMLRKPDGQ